ncbi:discoidin domain-containing protein [uncultured Cetobacterium sp.]|uniref:discoidin domain-containing protein n=1 Tax=uncultured Cetobacterium sp. TaxID=527638 RepID=UPI0025EEDD6C|nr:discoidin domain-containing protein [uncultured Cetobacterium sp.]
MRANIKNEDICLVFSIETNIKNVMNKIQLTTSETITSAEISYIDNYGHQKISKLLNSQVIDGKVELVFDYFYAKKFDLKLYEDILEEQIQGISIISLDQNEFYEDKDVDVRLDKSLMTATSHCGQHASHSADRVIDNSLDTYFHSAGYSGNYADFTIDLGKKTLIDRVRMVTRSNSNGTGNGRILAYEILYKTSVDEEWQKVFTQLTEESGDDREAFFKPVLASEICIRVTNGKNKYVMIYEVDIFKYNLIEERIANLFLDETENDLKDEVTIEDIEALERELTTESYLKRIENAKIMYLKRMLRKYFEIPLTAEKIFDQINFKTTDEVLGAHIKYVDTYGVERLIESEVQLIGDTYTISINKIMTSKAYLVTYGVKTISEITTNSYDRSEFCLDGDVDLRVPYDKIEATTTHPNTSYPISNMFDGDTNSQFHCKQYTDRGYCDVFFKLDKEYLIDNLRLISHRSNTSGLMNKFKVLLKDTNSDNKWAELGEYKVETYQNKWLEVRNKPYLTNEVCLRIEDSVNSWALINELELSIYSKLREDINNLFIDEECEALKPEVTLELIEELESKVLTTEEFREKLAKAKDLYVISLPKNIFEIPLTTETKFDKVRFTTSERVLKVTLNYLDSNNEEVVISPNFEKDGDIYTISTDKIITSNAWIVLNGINEVKDINTNRYVPKNVITATSSVSTYGNSTPDLMLDEDESTYFHSNKFSSSVGYGDVYLLLEKPEIISKIEFKTWHPTASNGMVQQYEILYKESKESASWKRVFTSEVNTSKGWRLAEFQDIYVEEICIRVNQSYGNWIVINELDICTDQSEIKENLEKIYTDMSCTKVRDDVKLRSINRLIEIYPDSMLGMKAKMLWLNDNNLEIVNFKTEGIDANYENYENVLRIENCIDLLSTPYRIENKTDYLIESNRDLKLCIISEEQNNPVENIIQIRKGKNLIYSKYIFGTIFILREDTAAIELSLYNVKKSKDHYKVGEYDVNELLSRKDSNSIVTLETKNFIIRGDVNWILTNLNQHQFIDGMANLDYALDYITHLIDKNQSYTTDYRVSNLKRVFWQNLSGTTGIKSTDKGAYIEFNKDLGFLFQDRIENLVKDELSEIFSTIHISKSIYGPAICSFVKTLVKKMLLLKNQDVINIPTTNLEALATKLFLFSNNDRIVTYIYKYLQKEEIGQSNHRVLSKICLWITEFLERDISLYFIACGVEIEKDILVECNTYIEPKIDINEITFENYKELVALELERFNESYTSLVNGNGGDTGAE